MFFSKKNTILIRDQNELKESENIQNIKIDTKIVIQYELINFYISMITTTYPNLKYVSFRFYSEREGNQHLSHYIQNPNMDYYEIIITSI